MERSEILIKTPKGADEIKTRTNKLAQKYRSLLIQVDGSATIGDLIVRYPGLGEIETSLQTLVDEGYLEAKRGTTPTPAPTPAPSPLPASAVVAPPPAATVDGATLNEAVRILCRQLYELIGPTADDFTGKLEAAHTREDFLATMESCNRMVQSFAGRKKAELFLRRGHYVADRFLPDRP